MVTRAGINDQPIVGQIEEEENGTPGADTAGSAVESVVVPAPAAPVKRGPGRPRKRALSVPTAAVDTRPAVPTQTLTDARPVDVVLPSPTVPPYRRRG